MRKIVTRLTNDTLKEAGLKGRIAEKDRQCASNFAWDLHSSFFYSGVREHIYGMPKVDLSPDVIAQRVARHFLGSSQVLAGRSRNA